MVRYGLGLVLQPAAGNQGEDFCERDGASGGDCLKGEKFCEHWSGQGVQSLLCGWFFNRQVRTYVNPHSANTAKGDVGGENRVPGGRNSIGEAFCELVTMNSSPKHRLRGVR